MPGSAGPGDCKRLPERRRNRPGGPIGAGCFVPRCFARSTATLRRPSRSKASGRRTTGKVPSGVLRRHFPGGQPHAHRRLPALPFVGQALQAGVLHHIAGRRLGPALPGPAADGAGVLRRRRVHGPDPQHGGAGSRRSRLHLPSRSSRSGYAPSTAR